MTLRILSSCIQFLLIILFVYTGISKWISHDNLQMVLEKMPLAGIIARPLSVSLPIIEITIAILFLFPATVQTAMRASFILLSIFTVYLLFATIFVPHLPCSCGGVIATMSWKQHILFNAFFIAFSIIGIKLNNTKNFVATNRPSLHGYSHHF